MAISKVAACRLCIGQLHVVDLTDLLVLADRVPGDARRNLNTILRFVGARQRARRHRQRYRQEKEGAGGHHLVERLLACFAHVVVERKLLFFYYSFRSSGQRLY